MPLIEYKVPTGLYTANTRGGGLRWHPHKDWSCELDAEQIAFGASHWEIKMGEDMRACSVEYLSLHYPELIFCHSFDHRKPIGHDFAERTRAGWMVADWRK